MKSPSPIGLQQAGEYLLLLLSAATLAFEVILIRLFALAQGYHFAFMAVSLALLGAGASGAFLSLRPPPGIDTGGRPLRQAHLCLVPPAVQPQVRPPGPSARTGRCGQDRPLQGGTGPLSILGTSALLFTLTAPASYLLVNVLPFDAYRIAWERVQLLWLALYYLALTVPFFFSGLAVGAALVALPEAAHRLYAANLLGAGLGPPLALLALATVGGPGAVFGIALLGALAFLILIWQVDGRRSTMGRVGGGLLAVACGLLFLFPPPVANIRLTPYQPLSQALLYPGSRVVFQRWNAFSRVDVIESAGIRSAPGLSMAYAGRLPPQVGLTVDGQNLWPITPAPPSQAEFADYLPSALAYRLRPAADVLVIEPGGGLAVLTALRGGARSVTAVYSNAAVAAAVRQWGGDLVRDPRLTVVVDEPRSYLRREGRRFDLVILPLTDSFRPVTAGAYALSEDYRYTVEAFVELRSHLAPDGLLVAERWLQLPPTECLRLWGISLEALRRSGVRNPGAHLVALRSFQTSLVVAGRAPFTADDLRRTRDFAAARQYDLTWMPDLSDSAATALQLSDETLQALGINRYNVVSGAPHFRAFAGLLAAPDPTRFYADYPYAVAPPTDDHPFFFHFFKWRQTPAILAALGKTWQPFGGSGYLVLVLLLALTLLLSGGLILLPSLKSANWRSGEAAKRRISYLLYFSLLGLGFLFVEIPLLQQFIVYLGQPAYAFAVVVGALLVASGVGSRYLANRIPAWLGLASLAALVFAYPILLPPLFGKTFGLSLVGRVAVSALALAPLGMLMGTPFPQGLALARRHAPDLLPWIWAVNGCASVVSAVLAPMVALDLGFRVVMVIGAVAYLGALLLIRAQVLNVPLQPDP